MRIVRCSGCLLLAAYLVSTPAGLGRLGAADSAPPLPPQPLQFSGSEKGAALPEGETKATERLELLDRGNSLSGAMPQTRSRLALPQPPQGQRVRSRTSRDEDWMMLDRESSSDAAAFEAAAGVTFLKTGSGSPSRAPAASRADRDALRLKQTPPGGESSAANASIEFNPQFRDPVSLDPVFSVRGTTPAQGRTRVVDARTARFAQGDRSAESTAAPAGGAGLLGLDLGTSELTPVANSIRQLIDGTTPGKRDTGADPLNFDHDSTRDELNPFEPSQLVNSNHRFQPDTANPNSVANRRARLNSTSPLRELTARVEGNSSLSPTLSTPSVSLDAVRPLQSSAPFELPGRKF